MRLTPSTLKYYYKQHNPQGHFFDRETMRHWGDTMRNYGVRSKPIPYIIDGLTRYAWELYRKKPVKYGLQSSAFFDVVTLSQVFGVQNADN